MPDDKPQDDRPASGIRNVSVGFGPSVSARPEPVAPAPPYRVLVAGDFALGADGERQALAGRDITELLEELSPAFEVIVENRLGTMPASLAVPIRLDGLAALRPASLIDRFAHHRHAAGAVRRGDRESLAASGQACDRLVALLPQRHEQPEDRTSGGSPADTGGDDLDALFDLVDTSKDGSGRKAGSAAGRSLQQFIDEAITPRATRPGSSSDESARGEAAALLDEQALALTSDMRLRQVLENWHGLRLFLQAARTPGIAVTLVQIGPDADATTAGVLLAGENGVLQEELFDLVLMAGRCAATGAGADMLKALADAADAFGSFAFATLMRDFAGVAPGRLAAMDAPHQLVDGAGFAAFRALRARPAAERLALFWNDVLALEAAPSFPAFPSRPSASRAARRPPRRACWQRTTAPAAWHRPA